MFELLLFTKNQSNQKFIYMYIYIYIYKYHSNKTFHDRNQKEKKIIKKNKKFF